MKTISIYIFLKSKYYGPNHAQVNYDQKLIVDSATELQEIWITLKNLQKCQMWLIEFQEVFFFALKRVQDPDLRL